ncbi:MAG: tetratricopeptide repeat protein [Chloroflexota bacterium]
MDNYFNLGPYSRSITTHSPEAEVWFNRGLNWCYGFHFIEALRCFKKVLKHDPECAMGYWGLAYALGPYYNMPWTDYAEDQLPQALADTFEYSRKAQKLAEGGTAVEQALTTALIARFPVSELGGEPDFAEWDTAYANAMREVYAQFPEDDDVCALTAEALMCRTPWQLWNLEARTPADGADTAEALDIIEKAFARIEAHGEVQHPGLLHFFIHIREMSHEPEKALKACDTLLTLVPDCGHLVHMPSHVYILCGLYEKSLNANRQATVADYKYLAHDDRLSVNTIYRLHNLHFQIYSALFMGDYDAALRAADEIVENIPEGALQVEHEYLVNYLEGYSGMKVHVYIRFGKWQEIIDEPMPEDQELYCVTTAMWHYGKGVAFAATGDIENAEKQQALFKTAVTRVPEERIVFNNSCLEVLKVAEAMLAGELEYRKANYDDAFSHLRRTVSLYDGLSYTEPWPWMQPPRHALGALLLEQGHVEEATAVYRADLGLDDTLVRPSQHPNNVWSLHGYAECLETLGNNEAAKEIKAQLELAQATANVEITSSCFCRNSGHCC